MTPCFILTVCLLFSGDDGCHSSDEEEERDNQGDASMEVDELQDGRLSIKCFILL